ncbi:MAG: septum formation initiator family protein [Clostridia bacterium]|nr:septum formation initiator family protein [Clostridia bacterium]
MADRKKSKSKYKTIRLFIIIVLCVYFSYSLITQQVQIYTAKKQISELDAEITQQQQTKEELQKKKELINTPEFIEKYAREELGLVAPDEIIFMEAPKNTSK